MVTDTHCHGCFPQDLPKAAAAPAGSSRTPSQQQRTAATTTTTSSSSSRQGSHSSFVFAPAPNMPGLDAASSWVVFSDLHVSNKTMQSALEVLRRVHEEAASRQAGILFLGECYLICFCYCYFTF
jgi:hypothetical protein